MSESANKIYAEFATRGLDDVMKALETIEHKVLSLEQTSKAAARTLKAAAPKSASGSGASGGGSSVTAALKAQEAEYRAFARRVDRIKEVSATMAGKQAAKEANAKIKEEERAATAIARIRERNANDQARASRAVAREEQRAKRDLLKEVVTPGRRVSLSPSGPQARLALLTNARNGTAAEQHAAVQRSRDLAAEHGIQHTADQSAVHEANERRQRYVDAITGGTTTAFRTAIHGGAAVTRTALDLGGGFDVQTALKEKVDLERESIRFSNSAFQNRPGEKRLDSNAIQQQAKVNAIKYGTDAGELLAGSAAYGGKSGDYAGALTLQPLFAKIAKGTNASVKDVASTAGILRVQNPELGEKEMQSLLLNTIRAGQKGSIEFSDLGKVAGNFTRSSASYAGDQGTNQGKLLGLGQVAMATAGRDPREAATVITNIASDSLKHADKIDKLVGHKVLNEQGQIKASPEDYIADVMTGAGGNLQKIQDAGFGARSMKMFQAVGNDFNRAKSTALSGGANEKDANQAGREAILSKMHEMTDASMSMNELETNVSLILKSSAEQFEATTRQLKQVVGDELLPVLKDLVPVLQASLPALREFLSAVAGIAQWAASHPLESAFIGLGASITQQITAQIATAQIGELLKKLLLMSGGGGGSLPIPMGGGGGGAGTGMATAGAAGTGAGAGMFALGGVAMSVYGLARLADQVISSVTEGHEAGRQAGEDVTSGDDERVARGRQAIGKAQGQYTGENRYRAYTDIAGRAFEFAYAPAAAIGSELGDYANERFGYQSNAQRRSETLRAGGLLSDDTVQKDIATGGSGGGGSSTSGPIQTTDPANTSAVTENTAALNKLATVIANQPNDATSAPPRKLMAFSRGPAPMASPGRGDYVIR